MVKEFLYNPNFNISNSTNFCWKSLLDKSQYMLRFKQSTLACRCTQCTYLQFNYNQLVYCTPSSNQLFGHWKQNLISNDWSHLWSTKIIKKIVLMVTLRQEKQQCYRQYKYFRRKEIRIFSSYLWQRISKTSSFGSTEKWYFILLIV